ncbi:ATP-binding protein [Dokdonella immobilis]|uniref:histidine kinase n=1 Tax=Dokdonella immobilis TaxID=578942 RepID=A0A1I4XA77_9GAMM|nr:ATP-binding protein [Dokdonella immobilis]SFN22393.1 dedicated sortase system histidine kinase [Dokdonella immobilis]
MSLRLKLLLVALSTLTLPWAGWQFVRQTEAVLRQGQEQTLLASASTLARALDVLGIEPPQPDAALYVHERSTVLRIDGYADDWQPFRAYAQTFAADGDSAKLEVMLAEDAQWLYLFAQVRDATRQRVDARDPAIARSDYLDLVLSRGDQSRRYRIASAAPGSFDAPAIDGIGPFPDRLTGEWQEDGSSYSIELRMRRDEVPDHLRFDVHDSAVPDPVPGQALALLGYNETTAHMLARLAPEHVRVRMVSADGWLVAAGGSLDAVAPSSAQQGWLAGLIYRNLLAPESTDATARRPNVDAFGTIDPRLQGEDLWQALSGAPATGWRSSDDGGVLLVAAVPLRSRDALLGALVLEQANPALPMLANRALSSLLGASLLALLVTAALLLLFGGLLSWRIRRLRNATERATRAGGRLSGPLPLADANDELGDLARSFGRLFDEVEAYTEYLRTLASKLSHELNTPLAIVKSSLDNLDHQGLPADSQSYLDRARDGAGRLGAIVRAMSESSRVERAIASADAEDFDLRALVAGCAEGYRALAGTRDLRVSLPDSPLPFHGAPDLLAQALDKLFDNARSFSAEDGWIAIGLRAEHGGVLVTMANSGPALPRQLQDRLFDSLVSLRERSSRTAGETPHLGLGLHVVRLVAELHRGRASAANLADGSGVEFSLRLAGMPRRRLSESDST